MSKYQPATQPTLYFIGVTTGKSSIMKVFPAWAEYLGLKGAVIKGIDFKLHDDPAAALSAVRPGTVVFIDSVDLVTGPEAETALTALLARVRADGAVVLCAAVEDHLTHFSLDGTYAAPAIAHEGSRA